MPSTRNAKGVDPESGPTILRTTSRSGPLSYAMRGNAAQHGHHRSVPRDPIKTERDARSGQEHRRSATAKASAGSAHRQYRVSVARRRSGGIGMGFRVNSRATKYQSLLKRLYITPVSAALFGKTNTALRPVTSRRLSTGSRVRKGARLPQELAPFQKITWEFGNT